ncbi:MAG: hypothetical protein KQI62_09335 [Deltaproteobacteria bacterium]|nr:hypothetical protein [Deltaproteobacteria bacterium]
MRVRSCLIILAVLLLAVACSSPAEEPIPTLLNQLGFSQAPAPHEGELLYKKPVNGVILWVSLPQGLGQESGPVMMIKATGPGGVLSATTDQALTTRPEVGQLVEAASRGAYPPEALAEIFKLAQEAAAQPPHNGALMTSPKMGFSLRVPHTKGHLRLVLTIRHKKS